jgi:hypothetical protein
VWPSKAANFLKHADRDPEGHLVVGEVETERVLVGACAAYVDLMRMPTPEMTAYYAFWAVENEMEPGPREVDMQLWQRLKSTERTGRHSICAEFIRGTRNK